MPNIQCRRSLMTPLSPPPYNSESKQIPAAIHLLSSEFEFAIQCHILRAHVLAIDLNICFQALSLLCNANNFEIVFSH